MNGNLRWNIIALVRGLVDDIATAYDLTEREAQAELESLLRSQQVRNCIIAWPEREELKIEKAS